jgi:hypothetical protein
MARVTSSTTVALVNKQYKLVSQWLQQGRRRPPPASHSPLQHLHQVGQPQLTGQTAAAALTQQQLAGCCIAQLLHQGVQLTGVDRVLLLLLATAAAAAVDGSVLPLVILLLLLLLLLLLCLVCHSSSWRAQRPLQQPGLHPGPHLLLLLLLRARLLLLHMVPP